MEFLGSIVHIMAQFPTNSLNALVSETVIEPRRRVNVTLAILEMPAREVLLPNLLTSQSFRDLSK
jgi:hypothetical protein